MNIEFVYYSISVPRFSLNLRFLYNLRNNACAGFSIVSRKTAKIRLNHFWFQATNSRWTRTRRQMSHGIRSDTQMRQQIHTSNGARIQKHLFWRSCTRRWCAFGGLINCDFDSNPHIVKLIRHKCATFHLILLSAWIWHFEVRHVKLIGHSYVMYAVCNKTCEFFQGMCIWRSHHDKCFDKCLERIMCA